MADPVAVAIAEEKAVEKLKNAADELTSLLGLEPFTLPSNRRDQYERVNQLFAFAMFIEAVNAKLALVAEEAQTPDAAPPRRTVRTKRG